MIKAIIFDFDGVIADTEPLHFNAFRNVLSKRGLELSKEAYYENYLAYDDRTFFQRFYKDRGEELNKDILDGLTVMKSSIFDSIIKNNIKIYPGVIELINGFSSNYYIAIGSGALRKEIVSILKYIELEKHFSIIVSADDVEKCKPDPEVFLRVLKELNKEHKISENECLVIEDSIHGIHAAKNAGMRCLAVTNTYKKSDLKDSDYIIDSLSYEKVNDILLSIK